MGQNLSSTDIGAIRQALKPDFQEIREDLASVKKDTQEITKSLDGVVHMVRRHDQEFVILRAQQDKMHDVLVQKGVATEEDLSIV